MRGVGGRCAVVGRLTMPAVAAVLALGAGACGDDAGPGSGVPGPVLEGRLHAVGGGEIGVLWARWARPDGGVDSARVASDGSFLLATTGDGSAGVFSVDGPAPRDFHPVAIPLDATTAGTLDLLLIPTTWTIANGRYSGTVVSTPLDPVVDDDAATGRYSYFFGQQDPFDAPVRYLIEPMAWPVGNLPALVAFDRESSDLATSPADSAAIWQVFDGMEDAIGLDLFEPAAADSTWWPAGTDPSEPVQAGLIRIVRRSGRWQGRPESTEPELVFEGDLGAWGSDGRFSSFVERQRRLDAGLLMIGELEPLRLADGEHPWQTIVVHEMMHVLGVGHTCRIASPMGPCLRTAEPSAADVAYMEMLRAIVTTARADPWQGVVPSIIGERRIVLGLSALPEMTGAAPATTWGGLR